MLLRLESFFAARIPAAPLALIPALIPALLSVLFSTLLSPTAHATKIKLPDDVTYAPQQRFTAKDKKAFSNTTLEASFKQLTISHSSAPLGYMQLKSSGHQQSDQKSEKGTLYLNLVSIPPKGEESSPASRILGIECIKEDQASAMASYPTLATEKMRLTMFMGGQIAGLSHVCSLEEPITFQAQDDPQPTLSVPNNGHALSMKIEGINYDAINFTSPTLSVDGQNYTMAHGSNPSSLPESSTRILMYFVPDDQSFHDLHIHITRASGTAAASADRELTEQDLQHLANLTTLDTLVEAIRASGEIADDQISTIRTQNSANLSEASFQLLKQLLEKKASDMTAEFLADLLESENHRVLADRVRSGKLQITEQDEAFQAEMATVGGLLTPFAPQVATLMGFSEREQTDVKEDLNPGYKLLYAAYKKGKLHLIYPTCESLKITDLQRQVETNNRFPLLAAQLAKAPFNRQKAKTPVILPVPFDHLDYDLLRVRINSATMHEVVNEVPKEHATELLTQLLITAGDKHFSHRRWEELTYGANKTSDYEEDKWGEMMPYGKLIELLNKTKTLVSASLARYLVKKIESGEVEHELTPEDHFCMALHRKEKQNMKQAIAILLRLSKKDLPYREAHYFGIKCNGLGCIPRLTTLQDGTLGKQVVCEDYPTLPQIAQTYQVTRPAIFNYKHKLD